MGKLSLPELPKAIFGALLFGLSINLFFLPGGVVLGGVTGIATVLNLLFGLPVGLLIYAVNLPLLVLGWVALGRDFFVKTAVGIALSGFFAEVLGFLPVTTEDPLLCAILGGIAIGAGCGLMFSAGYTTGGSDIAAFVIHNRLRRFSRGQIIFAADALIITLSAVALGSFEGIFYSAVALFSYTLTLDRVTAGAERGRLALIFTLKPGEIADEIDRRIGRGVTIVRGTGHHSGGEYYILLCALKNREAERLTEILQDTDREAFTVFAETARVLGNGFRSPG